MHGWQGFFLVWGVVVGGWLVGEVPAVHADPIPPQAKASRPVLVIALVGSSRGLSQILAVLDRYPVLRVTLVPPERGWPAEWSSGHLPGLTRRLRELVAAGRVELALGLSERPVLPLLHGGGLDRIHLPLAAPPTPELADHLQDVRRLLAEGLQAFERTWGGVPKGFVAPEGAVDAALDGEFRRLGFQWVAAALGGPFGGRPVLPRFVADERPIYFDGSAGGMRWATKGSQASDQWLSEVLSSPSTTNSEGVLTVVFAEPQTAPQPLPPMSLIPLMVERSGSSEPTKGSPRVEWITPSRWIAEKRAVEVQTVGQPQGFGGRTWDAPDLSRWVNRPAQAAAWRWYTECRAAVRRYAQSGQVDPHRLKAALAELTPLASAEWFERFGEDEGAAERRRAERYFAAGIVRTYRLVNVPPPPELDQPLDQQSIANHAALQPAVTTYTPVSVSTSRHSVQFQDAIGDDHGAGTLAYPPLLANTTGALDLVSVTVSWTDIDYRFAIQLKELANPQGVPTGWSDVIVDMYLDVNHRVGAGTTALLPGRNAVTPPQDAWEYAISLRGAQASFYRTQGSAGAMKVADLPVEVHQPDRTVVVSAPSTLLRGDPARWGYLVLVMVEDRPTPGLPPTPPAPLIIYDMLDNPWTSQASLLALPLGGRPLELPMVRLSTAEVH